MKKLLLLVLLCCSSITSAVIPDSGWYYNPAEGGRGFNIEIQDNVLFMAGFVYDQAGNQLWLVSGGPMSSDRTFSGTATVTSGGQAIGAPYRAPTAATYGDVSITWTSTVTATVVINGSTLYLQRELFGFDFSGVVQPLFGELGMISGVDLFFGERITFDGTTTQSTVDGSTFAVGYRSGSPENVAVGQYSPANKVWAILIDSSPSYYEFFVFTFQGVSFIEGDEYVYLKGSSPTDSLPFVGSRYKSAQAVDGINAPGADRKEAVKSDAVNQAMLPKLTPKALSAANLVTLHRLEAQLASQPR